MRKKIMSIVVSFLVITGMSVPTMSYAVENITTNEEKTVDNASDDNKTVSENEGTEGLTIENGVVTGYTGTDTDVVIPEGVTEIGQRAFWASKITSIKLPDSLVKIDAYGIAGCNSLKEVVVPKNVTEIGSNAFANSYTLGSITLPEGLVTIGSYCFNSLPELKSLKIPSTVRNIGKNAFCSTGLKTIEIPEGITTLNEDLFSYSEIESVKLPKSLTKIEGYVFSDCNSLKVVEIPENVISMGEQVFLESKKIEKVIIYSKNIAIGSEIFMDANPDVVLYGYKGSTVETYAKENSIKFESLQDTQVAKVSFDADNGESVVTKDVSEDGSLDYTPKKPTKEGYTFVGWYKDTDDITTAYKNNSKYSQDTTYKAKYAHVSMLGAQGKLVVNDKSGIRFSTKLYNDGDEVIEKGTLIIPADLLSEGEALTLDTKKVAKSIGKVNYETNKEENSVTYLGTIINMPRSQFARQMTASSYVKYKDKVGNEYTVYSPYTKGSISINELIKESK